MRQVSCVKYTYQLGEAQQLTHQNRGRKSAHALPEDVKNKIAELYHHIPFEVKECVEGKQEGFRKYGVPLGLYSDQHTIFRFPSE